MRFNFFSTRQQAHVRKAQEYLQQANLSHIEHRMAADHHAALAAMYGERVARLESELTVGNEIDRRALRGAAPVQFEQTKRNTEAVLSMASS